MIGDFTVSRPSQILPTNENLSGIVRDNSEESGAFLFSRRNQISAMVGDYSRHMKTQFCTVGDIRVCSGMDFAHYQSPIARLQSSYHT